MLTIERSRAEGNATLNITSRDAAEGSYAITLNDGAWKLDGTGLAEAAQQAHTRQATAGLGDEMTRLIEEVGKHPEGIKADGLATQLKWDAARVRSYLSRAYEDGRVQKLKRGLYAPVTSVASVASQPLPIPECNTHNTRNTSSEHDQQVPEQHSLHQYTEDASSCRLCGTELTRYLRLNYGMCFDCAGQAINTQTASA